jgi:integrase
MARAGGKDRGLFQRKGDKAWWIRWACPYGHDHQERIGTKSFARHMYQMRKTQVKERCFCLAVERDKRRRETLARFDQATERYLEWAAQHRPRSMGMRRTATGHLLEAFGDTPLAKIGKVEVERYIQARLDAGAAPASINRERATLSQIFVKAGDWGLCDINPVKGSTHLHEGNEAPRPISAEEETRLFEVLPERLKPIVTLALHTGLRMGELRAQRWSDINLVDADLVVSQPKSGRREVLPLNDTAYSVLASLPQSHEVIFPEMPGDMSKAFCYWAKKAELPREITFHCLRDTYISRLAPYCAAPTLMALARHRSLNTTRRYLRIDERHLRQAVERLNPQTEDTTVARTVEGNHEPV